MEGQRLVQQVRGVFAEAFPAGPVEIVLQQRLEIHAFFEDIIKTCHYKKWFFGKCHIDKHIPIKFYALFNNVTPLK